MKLARPDVFHPKIVLAGCPKLIDGDGDDDGLVAALRQRGLAARWLSWDDPQTLKADLVILRATWDYIERLDEFLDWTQQVPNLLNAPEVVAWNTDKRYLRDLDIAGVRVLESEFFTPDEIVHLPAGEVVVKPAVGAGSVGAQRFTDHRAAREHAARLQESGSTVLVQPYDARVEHGETALVFLAGEQSHAFTKGPILRAPGSGRPSTTRAPTPRSRWRLPSRISNCGTRATRRWPRPRRIWASTRQNCSTRASTSSVTGIRSCWNSSWSNRAWGGVNSTRPPGRPSSAGSRSGSNQLSIDSVWVRSRIDAHSAAVAAVQAAAPRRAGPPAPRGRR